MKELFYDGIIQGNGIADAILHTHEPFIKDYLILHILLRKYNPKTVLEIGTHIGEGTQIICNALPNAKVYSLDLPLNAAFKTLQHPKLKNMFVGQNCKLPYIQLFGDSMTFDHPLAEAWFIDGEHDYVHARHETIEAIKQQAKLIIWHDADIPEVNNAITDSFLWNKDYELFRVTDTRIAYALHL